MGRFDDFLDLAKTHPVYGEWRKRVDKVLLCDKPNVMERVALRLRDMLDSSVTAIAAVNSPMQCMMKEVCAQCLCKHRQPDGSERYVFSCFNQHQPLYDVDFGNLALRQSQNALQEKVSNAWLSHVLAAAKTRPSRALIDPMPKS